MYNIQVFIGGFILGYLMVRDYDNLGKLKWRKSDDKDDAFGLTEAPFTPIPYPYAFRENPRDSQELMFNQARKAYDAEHPRITGDDYDETPKKLFGIHYDYESMRQKYEL